MEGCRLLSTSRPLWLFSSFDPTQSSDLREGCGFMDHWKNRIIALISSSSLLCFVIITGCAWFQTKPLPDLDPSQQLIVAILPVGLDLPITKLSQIRSMNGEQPQDESQELTAAIEELRAEARWLFLSRLATRWQFRFVPLDQVDAAAAALNLVSGTQPTDSQLAALRTQLEADVLVTINILDYGKVRCGNGWRPGC